MSSPTNPLARVNRGHARRTERGGLVVNQPIATVQARPVFLFCRGGEIDGIVVDADLHDGLNVANPGIPLDLEICCPRCGAWLHVDGHKKHINAYYLKQPKLFAHPVDGDLCVQTVVLSIDEDLRCPEPVGKTICGLHFRLDNNIIHKA